MVNLLTKPPQTLHIVTDVACVPVGNTYPSGHRKVLKLLRPYFTKPAVIYRIFLLRISFGTFSILLSIISSKEIRTTNFCTKAFEIHEHFIYILNMYTHVFSLADVSIVCNIYKSTILGPTAIFSKMSPFAPSLVMRGCTTSIYEGPSKRSVMNCSS